MSEAVRLTAEDPLRVRSMTGFAEARGASGEHAWQWTLRSVNGKGLDLRLRLPPGFEAAEPMIRAIETPLHRGNVTATLRLDREGPGTGLRVDEDALGAVIDAARRARKIAKKAGLKTKKPRPEGLLALGGSLRAGADAAPPGDEAIRAVVASFAEAAAALEGARAAEGAALGAVLAGQVDEIEGLVAAAVRQAEEAVPALRDRLARQLAELMGGELPAERVAQEAAMLAVKADVREELDRLTAHVGAARALLREEGAVGRKLDFLVQELAREASTLTTKAPTIELKRTGLDLRHVVDQLREQAANVE